MPSWHSPCSHLRRMNMLPLTNLPAVIGFTWKQLGLLAALGVVIGLVLTLIISHKVS